MLPALTKATSQITDPRFLSAIFKCVLIAIVLYALLLSAGYWLVGTASVTSFAWIDSIIDSLGMFFVAALGIALFPTFISVSVYFFLDEIASAVEDKFYPGLPPVRSSSFGESLSGALRFALLSIMLNLLAMPFYLVPGLNILVFFGLNGYLLGREYFDLVASRRFDTRMAKRLRGANKGALWVAGALIALLLSIPVVNMFAPIIATAFMVHLFETWRRRHDVT